MSVSERRLPTAVSNGAGGPPPPPSAPPPNGGDLNARIGQLDQALVEFRADTNKRFDHMSGLLQTLSNVTRDAVTKAETNGNGVRALSDKMAERDRADEELRTLLLGELGTRAQKDAEHDRQLKFGDLVKVRTAQGFRLGARSLLPIGAALIAERWPHIAPWLANVLRAIFGHG